MANQGPTPAQRAVLFAQMTRQHFQSDSAGSANEGGQFKFRLNKVRLTNRVRLEVSFDLKVVHASATSFVPHPFAPFTALRRVSVDMNNGFAPFQVSGSELYMYSLLADHSQVLNRAASGRGKVVMPVVSASGAGATNKVRFLLDLPLSLNDRDPVSLIVTQNQQTNVDVTVDVANGAALIGPGQAGYTATIQNLTIVPLQESFSVPPHPDARPDIGMLKIVHSMNESISSAKQVTVKLPTGMVYRKIAWYIVGSDGLPLTDSEIQGNFELVLNQSDTPYAIKPSMLAAINQEYYRNTLPDGMWALDFSYAGQANYAGMRDYVDTEQLTEFWLRFNAPEAGEIVIVYEQLARLIQNF